MKIQFLIFTIIILSICFTLPSFASENQELKNRELPENYTAILIQLPGVINQPLVWNEKCSMPTKNVDLSSYEEATKEKIVETTGMSVDAIASKFNGKVFFNNANYSYAYVEVPDENYENLTEMYNLLGFDVKNVSWGIAMLDQSRQEIGLPYNNPISGQGLTGMGRRIAILDTGLDGTHHDFWNESGAPPLNTKVVFWEDLVNNDPCCVDLDGHGTHVASIAAGTGNMSGGKYRGIAPNASLLIFRIALYENTALGTLAHAINDAVGQNPDVISISYGWINESLIKNYNTSIESACNGIGTQDIIDMFNAIQNALMNGIPVVVAAGNEGPSSSTIDFPACLPGVIAVGMTYKKDYPSNYSEYIMTASADVSNVQIHTIASASSETIDNEWWVFNKTTGSRANGNRYLTWSGFTKIFNTNNPTLNIKIEGQYKSKGCYAGDSINWNPGSNAKGDTFWTWTNSASPYGGVEVFAKDHTQWGNCFLYDTWGTSYMNTLQCTGTAKTCDSFNPYNQNGCTNQEGCDWCGCRIGGILGYCTHTDNPVADKIVCESLGNWVGCEGTAKSCGERLSGEEDCGSPSSTGCSWSWALDDVIVRSFNVTRPSLKGLPTPDSSRGPSPNGLAKPDVTAPGYEVCAAKASSLYSDSCGNSNYISFSGTSMATPMVAGLIALLKEVKPSANLGEIINAVRSGDVLIDYSGDNSIYHRGYGRINVTKATAFLDKNSPQFFNRQEPPNPSLYSPTATYSFGMDWTDDLFVNEVILEMDGNNYSYKAGQITRNGNTYSTTFSTCSCSSGDPSSGGGGGGGGHFYMLSVGPIIPILFLISIFLSFVVRIKKKYNILSIVLIALFINLFFVTISEASVVSCLSIGTHHYKWYASDTSNNWASTGLMDFTIYGTDPVSIYVYSPENITYSTNSVGVKYSIDSPFEISWIGYSLDNKPNTTLTGNTSLNLTEGSHNIIFYSNTTWGVMNNSQRVYFTVSLPKPDLIIGDIWTSGNTISYNIKNQGSASAGSSYSNLYVDDSYKAQDSISSLSIGSSNRTFSYSWTCSGTSDTIKVCDDANNNVVENNENNNCLTKTFTCPTPPACTCTSWVNTGSLCPGMTNGCYYKYTRTCAPKGCDAESKCVYGGKYCAI